MKNQKSIFTLLAFLLLWNANHGQIINQGTPPQLSAQLYFLGNTGDKISLYANRINQPNMYGFGVGDMTLYNKSASNYSWLVNQVVLNTDDQGDIFRKSSMHFTGGGINGTVLTLREAVNPSSAQSGEIRFLEYGNSILGGFMRYDGQANSFNIGVLGQSGKRDIIYIPRDADVVGIGTSSPDPDFKLSVNGKIRAKEVWVESNWADFVFEAGYALPTLDSVQSFIQQHGHLPGIPSADEISQNGLDLGAVQTLMMQKIEELTLYVMELKKENEAIKSQLELK